MNVFFRTFGCTSNFHDSEKLAERLREGGHHVYVQPVGSDMEVFRSAAERDGAGEYDVFVVNTCTISGESETRLQAGFGEAVARRSPGARIVYMGCSVQNERSRIHGLKGARILTARREELLPALERLAAEVPPRPPASLRSEGRSSAEVLVKRGCRKFCAFCACSYALAGEDESVPSDEVLAEVRRLRARGLTTATLAGPCISEWREPGDPSRRFAWLVRRILKETDARLGYLELHPGDVDDETLELLASPRVAKEDLSLPIDSASDRVLKLMRRGYDRAYLRRLFARLWERVPCAGVSTDIIVGFPTSTEAELLETLRFLCDFPFKRVDVYTYSPREGTPAARLPQLSGAELERQLRRVQDYAPLRPILNLHHSTEDLRMKPPVELAGGWTV